MAQFGYKVSDALNEIWLRLKGYGVGSQHVGGDAAAMLALVMAQQLVLTKIPNFTLAGSLATAASVTFTTGAYAMSSLTATCVIPKRVVVAARRSVLLDAEEFIHFSTRPDTDEAVYCFFGNNIKIFPTTITAGTFYYIKAPAIITAGTETLETSPSAFMAVCVRAALVLLSRYENIDTTLIQIARDEYITEVENLTLLANENLKDFNRTIAKKPGQG